MTDYDDPVIVNGRTSNAHVGRRLPGAEKAICGRSWANLRQDEEGEVAPISGDDDAELHGRGVRAGHLADAGESCGNGPGRSNVVMVTSARWTLRAAMVRLRRRLLPLLANEPGERSTSSTTPSSPPWSG